MQLVLTVKFHEVPRIKLRDRAVVTALRPGFWRVILNFGFMDVPDVPRALGRIKVPELHITPIETTYFLSREVIVPTPGSGMMNWRERLFAMMSRNASGVVEFFRLPDNAVVELGTRVQI